MRLIIGILLPALMIIAWHLAVVSGVLPSSLIASPAAVIVALVSLTQSGEVFLHIWASGYRLLAGFLLGSICGVLAGLLVGVSRYSDRVLSPTLSILAPIPPVAWIPLLIVFFGIGDGSKVALIAIGAFFVTQTSAVAGIRGADSALIELARANGKSSFSLARHILVPAAMYEVFTSARIALALSWILLIAAEVIASSNGLGWLIWDSRNFARPDEMIAAMVVVGVLGKVTDSFLLFLQRRVLKWKTEFSGT